MSFYSVLFSVPVVVTMTYPVLQVQKNAVNHNDNLDQLMAILPIA